MTFECPECGNEVPLRGGYAECWGREERHPKVTLARPCEMCGDPIVIGEICQTCAENYPGDAFTTNWGSGRSF